MNVSSARWFRAYARRALYGVAVAVVCVQAVAQEKLQEVVVTAERREENIQNVPIAITAVTTETLRSKGVTEDRKSTRLNSSHSQISYAVFCLKKKKKKKKRTRRMSNERNRICEKIKCVM